VFVCVCVRVCACLRVSVHTIVIQIKRLQISRSQFVSLSPSHHQSSRSHMGVGTGEEIRPFANTVCCLHRPHISVESYGRPDTLITIYYHQQNKYSNVKHRCLTFKSLQFLKCYIIGYFCMIIVTTTVALIFGFYFTLTKILNLIPPIIPR